MYWDIEARVWRVYWDIEGLACVLEGLACVLGHRGFGVCIGT